MKSKAIFTIFKKELARFFKDRRTLIALIMPGLLIYSIYSLMGDFMGDAFMPDEEYTPSVSIVRMPKSLSMTFTDESLFNTTEITDADIQSSKDAIRAGSLDLLIIFSDKFDDELSIHSAYSATMPENIEIFYNSSITTSSMAYQTVVTMLDNFESIIANVFDINRPTADFTQYDLATDEDMTGMIFSMMMPMLLIMLLFSGCMAVAPESIAGEKERGTIATLLITPTKRSHIAIGKILALSVMALLSGTSSTLGTILSLPKLMGEAVELDGAVYGMTDYLMLAVVILSTVMLFITLISIISAYAKTVKEASTYLTPLMILSMLVGLSGMMGSAAENPMLYAIPIYNSVQSMIGIFSFELNMVNVIISLCSNLIFTALGVFVLTRMFSSERIMFNK